MGSRPRTVVESRRRVRQPNPDVPRGQARQRMVLLASPSLRRGPLSPLQRFARDFEPFLHGFDIVTTEGCYRALLHAGVLVRHPSFTPTKAGYRGGIVDITAGVIRGVARTDSVEEVHVVVYFIDPRDPSSNFPETNALKRECVVNEKPFLATSRSAREWAALRWEPSGGNFFLTSENTFGEPAFRRHEDQTIALISHDKRKEEMLDFAVQHFEVLRRFKSRIGTGTTASLLNGERPPRLTLEQWEAVEPKVTELKKKIRRAKLKGPFVQAFKSGPHGGDVQIAHRVLNGGCDIVCFFEDPFVPREHEQDIQLLERTGRVRGKHVMCLHDPTTARNMASLWTERRRTRPAIPEPVLVATALQRAFGVEAVLIDCKEHTAAGKWGEIVRVAAWILYAEINKCSWERRLRSDSARVVAAWGKGLAEIVDELERIPSRLAAIDRDHASQGRELSRPLAHVDYLKPRNVVAAPMQGIMAADDETVESNEVARRLATQFGGASLELSLSAVLRQNHSASEGGGRSARLAAIRDHWTRADLLVLGCAPVREEHGGHAPVFRQYFDLMRKTACGDLGGLFIEKQGVATRTDPFERMGMSIEDIRAVKERGGSFLIVGADDARLEVARAALVGKLVSVLIADLDFGRRLLLDNVRG
jgi:methylglyoxal synthase